MWQRDAARVDVGKRMMVPARRGRMGGGWRRRGAATQTDVGGRALC